MTPARRSLFSALLLSASFLPAQCANDHRTNKNAGMLITDFTLAGTQAISATDLAAITSDMIGSCYDENSEEMGERVRASFQERGYFQAEVKNLSVKPSDPLGIPKPVTLEGEVSEGPRFRLGQVTFVKNHAFPTDELRHQFPLKTHDFVERGKVAAGLEGLRKLYGTRGYLDWLAIPDTEFASTMNLTITIEEGPQYHMGKLDILAEREPAARLRAEWKLAEGKVYDNTYINDYLTAAHDLLPANFSRANVQTFQNCPDALVHIRLIVDPAQESAHSELKTVPCDDDKKDSN